LVIKVAYYSASLILFLLEVATCFAHSDIDLRKPYLCKRIVAVILYFKLLDSVYTNENENNYTIPFFPTKRFYS